MHKPENQIRILMVGPARDVKGGMTTVVNNYFNNGLDEKVKLEYIESSNDKSVISKLVAEYKGIKRFKSAVRDYDIVHIHIASRRSTFRKIKYIKIAKRNNKKIVIHMHGGEFRQFYDQECNTKRKEYIKKHFSMADIMIVLSEEWKEYYKRIVDVNKIVIQYNSVSVPKDFKKDFNNYRLCFLGRISDRKGIFDLLDIMPEVINKYPRAMLSIGGDGEIRRLKERISDLKLKDCIKYLGWIDGVEKEQLLRNNEIFILPSHNEGMPMSVLEAMSFKNCVITTRVGGIQQIIADGVNGYIIEPGDKKDLFKRISYLLDSQDLEKQMSACARKTIENKFNIDTKIKELLIIYNDLLKKRTNTVATKDINLTTRTGTE